MAERKRGIDREVAVYRGDELLCMGSLFDCAKELHIRPETIYFYLMPVYQRRIAKRLKSDPNKIITVVDLAEGKDD